MYISYARAWWTLFLAGIFWMGVFGAVAHGFLMAVAVVVAWEIIFPLITFLFFE